MLVRAAFDDLLTIVLPHRCPGCGRRALALCAVCAATLAPAPAAPPPAPVAWWTACYAYAGAARELVARAKYRGERHAFQLVVPTLAGAIARAPTPVDVVTWIPASPDRLVRHGVDHGEVLARAVARASALPVAALLRRAPGPPQTGRDARARRAGPTLRGHRDVEGLTVLVVDDVATTGASVAAAARALRARRAAAVYAATVARTPAPGSDSSPGAYTPCRPSN